MQIERYTINKRRVYKIHSSYDGEDITVEPKELMQLLRYLAENEDQLVQDVLDNQMLEGMQEEGQL
jgi:hypothetical protein